MVYKQETTCKDYVVKAKLGTVIVVVTAMVSSLIGAGIAYEKIQARLRHLDGKTEMYAERYDKIEARVSQNEKQIDNHYIEIMTKLTNIEALLQK